MQLLDPMSKFLNPANRRSIHRRQILIPLDRPHIVLFTKLVERIEKPDGDIPRPHQMLAKDLLSSEILTALRMVDLLPFIALLGHRADHLEVLCRNPDMLISVLLES